MGFTVQRVRDHGHYGEEHGGSQVGMVLAVAQSSQIKTEPQDREKANSGWHGHLKPQSPLPRDMPFPAKSYFLMLSKHFHQLGTKHSNT